MLNLEDFSLKLQVQHPQTDRILQLKRARRLKCHGQVTAHVSPFHPLQKLQLGYMYVKAFRKAVSCVFFKSLCIFYLSSGDFLTRDLSSRFSSYGGRIPEDWKCENSRFAGIWSQSCVFTWAHSGWHCWQTCQYCCELKVWQEYKH